jgi:allantoinase
VDNALVIQGGVIAADYGVFRADILVQQGVIAAIGEHGIAVPAGARVIDARGLTIFPGGVDAHTHMREPSLVAREGITHGTMAAAGGGITTIIDMPQADPPATTVDAFRAKRDADAQGSLTDFALYAGAVGQPADILADLHAEGTIAFKSFISASSPAFPHVNDAQLFDALRTMAALGTMLTVHCENNDLLQAGLRRMQDAGRADPLAHAESRPGYVEVEAVLKTLYLAKTAGARVHIAHVSVPESAIAIAEARQDGQLVSGETCPQYLLMDEEDLVRLGPYARCAPAIRSRATVEALWPFLRDETLSFVCSDHSPYTFAEKERGRANIFDAPLGLSIIQVMFPALLSEAVHHRGMSLEQFARVTATNPARLFGLYPKKGTIRVGSDADFALYDLDATWTVDVRDLLSLHKWTPLEGVRIRGKVLWTVLRGIPLYGDGRILAAPGTGEFLAGNRRAVVGAARS